MRLVDVAKQYVLYNIYNRHTEETAIRACRLFDQRSGLADVSEITQEHIARFRVATLAVANAFTYNGYLGYIKMVAKWGEERGLLNAEQIRLIRKAPEPKAQKKVIENDDYVDLMSYLRRHPDTVPYSWFWVQVIQFIFRVGVRRRQLVEIQIRDIDFDRGILRLRYQGSKTMKEWDAPLIDPVLLDLRTLIDVTEAVLHRKLRPNDKVFNICYFNKRCTPDPEDEKRMRPEYVTQILKKISRESGIRVGAHRLRHTLATRLCNPEDPSLSADLVLAQETLGHSNIETTRGYVKANVANRRAYMESLIPPPRKKDRTFDN